MANTVPINPSTSGSPVSIYAEDLSGSVSMPASKIHTGANGTDGGAVTATNPLSVALAALTGGGASKFKFSNIGGAAWTQQSVKASAGTLFSLHILQVNNAAVYVQVFDLLTGNVTPGTTVPDFEFLIPAVAAGTDTTIQAVFGAAGVKMSTGIVVFLSTTEGGATGSAAGVRAEAVYI